MSDHRQPLGTGMPVARNSGVQDLQDFQREWPMSADDKDSSRLLRTLSAIWRARNRHSEDEIVRYSEQLDVDGLDETDTAQSLGKSAGAARVGAGAAKKR